MRAFRVVGGGDMFQLIIGVGVVAAWLTHVITCFQDGSWGFLIAGALLFPIAIVHGIGIWFGAW